MEQDFLIRFERELLIPYQNIATFSCQIANQGTINENIALIREWAACRGLLPEENDYRFAGQDAPLLQRTRYGGLIRYDIQQTPPDFRVLDIGELSTSLILHFDALAEQKGKRITNLFSSHSVRKIQRAITKASFDIELIIAESWLLDTVIGKRLGFTLLPYQDKGIPRNNGFWGQFIDQHGKIHEERGKPVF